MSAVPTILGIDGGGSKTLLAVADSAGRVTRMERAGGVNPMDNPRWRDVLVGALVPFATASGLAGIAAALPAFGEVESLSRAQQHVLAETFGVRPQLVLNDVDAAHQGAFAGGPGILILSGTGSMAWARDGSGKSFRVGGWGDQIGDEGSSYWLGRLVLSLVSQSIDGRAPPTRLVDAVFAQLRLDRADPMNALEGWVAHLEHPRPHIAALAEIATRLAEAGDAGAAGLVDRAAFELARHVTTVARQASLPLDWSFAGGTFASRALQSAVAQAVGRPPRLAVLPPIGGALLAAAHCAGWTVDDGFVRQLAISLQPSAGASSPDQPAPLAAPASDRQRPPN